MGRSRISVSITFFRDSLNNYGSVRRLVAIYSLTDCPLSYLAVRLLHFIDDFRKLHPVGDEHAAAEERQIQHQRTDRTYIHRETLSLVHVFNTEC